MLHQELTRTARLCLMLSEHAGNILSAICTIGMHEGFDKHAVTCVGVFHAQL